MRIAFFTDTFVPQINGIATMVANLAEGLGESGHEVIILVPKQNDVRRKFFAKKNVRVVYLPSVPVFVYPEIRMELFGFPKVFKTLKQFKPDIIHVHTPGPVGLDALFASYVFRVPLVGTLHTFLTEEGHTHWIRSAMFQKALSGTVTKYYRSFHELCDYLLVPSKLLLDELKHNALDVPMYHVPNAIPAQTGTKLSSVQRNKLKKKYGLKNKVVVHFGRLSGEKNTEDVLRSFKVVLEKRKDVTLLIIGDGPSKEGLEKLAKTLGIDANIVFTGFMDHTMLLRSGLLGVCDLFVSASITENQPMVVLEAMGFGLPVVGVKAAGMIELVKHNGFLTPTGDTNAMAEKILEVLNDPALRKSLSECALADVQEFGIEQVVARTIEHYTSFIKQGKRKQLFPWYDKQVETFRYNSKRIERMFNTLKLSIIDRYNEVVGK